ncbi:glycosyl hydrolase [Brevibacillus dissolubilis]|uniref:glycosyl hydrolase n=1 Tax=Brevibacillus dissolubilis TaxID=1844116 RepID=UPI001116AC21|nr:glycosyl hydrolase [Brevibacillus dissolubilis]
MKKILSTTLSLCLGTATFIPATTSAFTGEVIQGAGSYSTVIPPGATNVQSAIYKTANVTGKMPTNDWWSSAAWVQYSEAQYPHPLAVRNESDGLRIFYPGNSITANNDCICGWIPADTNDDFVLGHTAVATFDDTKVDGFSDWFVRNVSASGSNNLTVSYGHGSPYVYATYAGGNPKLTFQGTPTVWSGSAGSAVLGVTINGRHYALFGPSGSTWSGIGSNTLINNMPAGRNYFSIAVLPDNSAATLAKFQTYAYSHVTDTKANYTYNPADSSVTTTYTYTTQAKEGTQTGTIYSLYPHQWKNATSSLLGYTYNSVRGTMKLGEGSSFTTKMKYNGVLPSMPDLGSYNKTQLAGYIDQEEAATYTGAGDTYWVGKRLGQLAVLAPIADQVGDTTAANKFRTEIKNRLQSWLKASDSAGNLKTQNVFYYNNNWGTVIGYPDSYGSAAELNDHHFHYGYFIKAAAELARIDKTWGTDANWGSMINLLIRDTANWNRNDSMLPYLRNFDIFAGHSWAAGHGKFHDGNNNESSSEAMNAWTGLILWGEATGNTQIRDLGIYLYTTEMNAINEYWFDINDQNHHPSYTPSVVTMIWGGKGANGTWFTANPEQVHGINYLPITAGSLYLGHNPAYVKKNYDALVAENGGTNFDAWEDLIYMYRALENPTEAINMFNARASVLKPEEGNSKAHTYHWIHNLNNLGKVDTTVTANYPLYAVFNKNGVKTYIAYNMTNTTKTVTFSDGKSITVNPNSFNIGNGSGGGGTPGDTTAPTAPGNLVSTGKTSSSVSLSWSASTDNVGVSGYDVYRGSTFVGSTSGTSYTDSGLAASTAYTYTVKAKDAAGNVSAASNAVTVTTDAGAVTPTSNVLYVRDGASSTATGTLSTSAGTGANTDTVATAGGQNYDGVVHTPNVYTISGVNGTYDSTKATAFNFFVDSGASVGNGLQVRVSYDFTGDGTYDRLETYNYFATNDITGLEDYNQTRGLQSATGSFANLVNGKVRVELWSAIGNGTTNTIRTDATSTNGNQSKLVIPFK